MGNYKLVVFDMDGTLIKEKGIFVIAEKLGFYDELIRIFKNEEIDFYKKSILIAKLSKGFSEKEYLRIFREIPYSDNVERVIEEIKKRNIKTAIVTDSYKLLADDLKNRLSIDYAFANNLLTNNGIFTGEIEINNRELVKEKISGRIYSICKERVLEGLCKDLKIFKENTIAVGDGRIDMGMISVAGLGIAYRTTEDVQKVADIFTDDLSIILDYI